MSATRRFLPTDPADFLRAIVPLALLALAARSPRSGCRCGGRGVGNSRRDRAGGAGPVGLGRRHPGRTEPVLGGLARPDPGRGGADCADPASPIALWRAVQAVLVLGVLGVLACSWARARTSLGLRLPARAVCPLGGRRVSRHRTRGAADRAAARRSVLRAHPYDVTVIGAIVPALVFATANGVMEEVTYRGALLGWSSRVMGVGPALVGQAVVFGLAHSGTDVTGGSRSC